MQNERGRRKAERKYFDANPLQRCIVCGRLFVQRRDHVCSTDCLRKSKESQCRDQ